MAIDRKIFLKMNKDRILLIIRYTVWLQFACLLFRCEPVAEPYRQFTIYRGQHYALPRVIESLQSETLVFYARFNNSAIYHLNDSITQCSRNKLMGFCDCDSRVHENSARFAWLWLHNRLEIYAYCYVKGRLQEQFVGVADINKYSRYEIELTDKQYIFRFENNPSVYMKRSNNCTTGIYYKLWPYFGGHASAPHDVTIDIKSIY